MFGFAGGGTSAASRATSDSSSISTANVLVAAVITYLAAYWGHSAVASIQIGWMGVLGWSVPERYRWPFLADSPIDFWRRWNIYWGAWLLRYVFNPLAHRFRRRYGRERRNIAIASAVVATFVVSGLLHDYAVYAGAQVLTVGATVGFVAYGVGLLAWHGMLGTTGRHPMRRIRVAGGLVTLLLLGMLEWVRRQGSLEALFAGLAA